MSSDLELTLSFWNIRVRWLFTVGSLIWRRWAISLFLSPLPISPTTSLSLPESEVYLSLPMAFTPWRMFLKVFLSIQTSPLATARIAFLRWLVVELERSTPLIFLRRTAVTMFSMPQLVSSRRKWTFLPEASPPAEPVERGP